MRKSLFVFLLSVILLPLMPSQAASVGVNNEASLIAAINAANSTPETDSIEFLASITITAPLPTITSDMTILGNGFSLDGNSTGITLYNDGGNLIVLDLTITGGSGTFGGGVYNSAVGSLTIINSSVSSNTSSSGGGGLFNWGQVSIVNSSISSNTSPSGGGLYNYLGSMDIINSTIAGNSAASGGGIYNYQGTLNIRNSSVSGNTVTNAGAGMFNWGPANIFDSTFSGNSAGVDGGGILNYDAPINITNSTISGNSAMFGGGFYSRGSTVVNNADAIITTSTISNNSATTSGGGMLYYQYPTTTFNNSIIANSINGDCFLPADPTLILNNTLIEDNSCIPTYSGDPSLGVLANTGGPTQTHALLVASTAIDLAGTCGQISDQRGARRATNDCDLGAYEYDVIVTYPSIEFSSPSSISQESDGTVTLNFSVSGGNNFSGIAEIYVVDALSGTAVSPSDYGAVGLKKITIDCSSSCPTIVSMPLIITPDVLVETDEIVDLSIVATNGFVNLGAQTSHQVTIKDDDPLPITTIAPPPAISVFDPAISKLGFLVPGQTGIQGEQLEWIVTVSNTSSVVGQNVIVSDTLVDGLQIKSVDAPNAIVSIVGQTVTVTYPVLNVGETTQFSIFTNSLTGEIVSNTACIDADNQGVEECATGTIITQLPTTGESPWWRTFVLFLSLPLIYFGVSAAKTKIVTQK